ncbi:DUF6330 family protein [Sulfitobacter dubius]|uniref:Uncharacterized protein n=1 Tax=Sulfitobacter dubius TaxID=218673 RepID=A0ABY3ZRN1_9RHOB|nr:DUF6330 family protein [Sulfitobacter dubius]UOA16469.1 hypothetical protein DSM109990_03349 [Sulfitobacter dubius]
MSRKEPKTLRVACFADGRRKIITFKRGAYWWSPSEGCSDKAPSASIHPPGGKVKAGFGKGVSTSQRRSPWP